jgi:hypothetical protein
MTPGSTNDLSDQQLADLARLADGTLPAERRAEVEAAVAASPVLATAFEQQAHALRSLRATSEIGAPARLRAQVERRRAGSTRGRGWSLSPRVAFVAAAAAATLAVVLVLPGALSGSLSVQDAAAYATKQPTAAAPATLAGTPQLLREDVGGVPFPNYAAKFGWKPVGARHDSGDSRDATTVYYEKNGRTLAYTIVSGDALSKPGDADLRRRSGAEYRVFRTGNRTAVTWERGGHTCILSAEHAGASELVALADWRGKGAIPF